MKLYTSILTILISFNTHALTNYSNYITGLQNTFGNLNPKKQIIFLDRDQLNFQFAQTNTSETDKLNFIISFVENLSEQKIKSIDAEVLLNSIEANSYSAFPLTDIDGHDICIVVPSNPNLNQTQSHLRMLNWDSLKDKDEYKNKKIKKPLDLKVMNLLTDVHEAFHCLDQQYLPEAIMNHDDFHALHRAEAFAEVGALLYLKQQGYDDINETRAQLREVGSTLAQKYIPPNPFRPGPWGAIYSLQTAIRSIDSYIQKETFNFWSIKQLMRFAYAITEVESLNEHEFYGISILLSDALQIEALIEKYKDTSDFPYLQKRYQLIDAAVRNHTSSFPNSLNDLLEDDLEVSDKTNTDLTSFNFDSHCPTLLSDVNIHQYVDEIRSKHYEHNKYDQSYTDLLLENIFSCFHLSNKSR